MKIPGDTMTKHFIIILVHTKYGPWFNFAIPSLVFELYRIQYLLQSWRRRKHGKTDCNIRGTPLVVNVVYLHSQQNGAYRLLNEWIQIVLRNEQRAM
jgi:hypothetical protein